MEGGVFYQSNTALSQGIRNMGFRTLLFIGENGVSMGNMEQHEAGRMRIDI